MLLLRYFFLFALVGLMVPRAVSAGGTEMPAAQAEFSKTAQPFFAEHCDRCHGEKKHKGDFRMDTLSRDFASGADAGHWSDVLDRISAAEMPPEDEKQPTAEERGKIVEWLAAKLEEGKTARLAKRERVSFRKL